MDPEAWKVIRNFVDEEAEQGNSSAKRIRIRMIELEQERLPGRVAELLEGVNAEGFHRYLFLTIAKALRTGNLQELENWQGEPFPSERFVGELVRKFRHATA